MKPSLQLRVSQQLTMTPQLQQAIKLLQLSTLDLQAEIQEALDSNPLLEMYEESPSDTNAEAVNSQSPEAAPTEQSSGETTDSFAEPNDNTHTESLNEQDNSNSAELESTNVDNIPTDLPVDTQWDDIFQHGSANIGPAPSDDDYNFDNRNTASESLQDHLLSQLNVNRFSNEDQLIALAIIDSINNRGRLTTSTEDILEGFDEALEIELDEVESVLTRIQHFDPIGVASRDLRECLLIQLNQLHFEDEPALTDAKCIITDYINLLGNRDYAQILRKTHLKEPQLQAALKLIQTLSPCPGEDIQSSNTEYVVPDVFVAKKKGRWTVELNPDIAPKIRINSSYASMVKRADSSTDNHFLRDNLQEARWFLKSLQSRNETLLKVATRIVEIQRGFLEYGEEAMKPLVLHDIAEAVEMHESTISRVTTQKYMHTPRGIFELKYFFSSHVSTDTGGECSSTAIRALIKKLVAAENTRKPLSDNKITQILAEQGINVARRTIAKYRESLAIPPSNERKRLV